MDLKEKTEKQKEITNSISFPAKSLLHLSQRLGKTKCIIDYIKKHKISKVLWVTPSAKLANEEIPGEFIKWKAKIYLKDLVTVTYTSLPTITGFYDLIILDEWQSLTSKNMINILSRKLVYTGIIAMTGTPSKNQEKINIINSLNLKLDYELLLNEAVETGILSDYKINIVNIPYCKEKLQKYAYWDKIIQSHVVGKIEFKNMVFRIVLSSTSYLRRLRYKKKTEDGLKLYVIQNANLSDGYVLLDEESKLVTGKIVIDNETYKITNNYIHRNVPKSLNINRQNSLGNSQLKIEIAKKLLEKLRGERNIVFAKGIPESSLISKSVYNSKSSNEYFDKFQSFESNELVLVNIGGTGFSFSKVDNLILLQCGNDNNGHISQKLARALIKEDYKDPKLWLLNVETTPDKRWIEETLKGFDINKVNYVNYGRN